MEKTKRLHACSIRAFCDEFGLDRDTTARRITESGIKATGHAGRWSLYRLRDLCRVALGTGAASDNPDDMDSYRRKAAYQAELLKLRIVETCAALIPRDEVEREDARAMRIILGTFAKIPVIIERDCGASPGALARVERALEDARIELRRLASEVT